MTFAAAALAIAADAVETAVTHVGLHNGAPGASGTTNVVGTRQSVTSKVAGNATVTLQAAFTGLTASQAVTHVSYWTASTGGTFLGSASLTGDLAANAAGAITVSVTETLTASLMGVQILLGGVLYDLDGTLTASIPTDPVGPPPSGTVLVGKPGASYVNPGYATR